MFRAIVAFCGAILAAANAAERTPGEWTIGELRAWFVQFVQTEPDGERGLVYNGTDATHHRFSALVAGVWTPRDVRKSWLVMTEELPFSVLENGQRGRYYYVDPARDFIRVPNPQPPPSEKRSLEERLNALEAFLGPSAPPAPVAPPAAELVARAEKEMRSRLPDARISASELSFPSDGVARYAVIYTLPERKTRWMQLIHFHRGFDKWHLTWSPDCSTLIPPARLPPSTPAEKHERGG